MEPQWMKKVPSNLICDTYYAFFVIYAVIFGIALLNTAYTAFYLKGVSPVQKVVMLVLNATVSVVAVTLVMFMYLMCDRALIAPQMAAAAAAAAAAAENFADKRK
jgi:hypothetical protein